MTLTDRADTVSTRPPTPTPDGYSGLVSRHLVQRRQVLAQALSLLDCPTSSLSSIASGLVHTLRHGGKILVAGNGGSAAEAQHFAAELVGRFQQDRSPYAAIALCTDTSILTAIANDYGYEHVFSRQVLGLGRRGDLLLLFSTSGESENIVRAALAARQLAMTVVAIVGESRCRLERLATMTLHVPAEDAATAQELHMIVTHLLCTIVEAELSAERDRG